MMPARSAPDLQCITAGYWIDLEQVARAQHLLAGRHVARGDDEIDQLQALALASPFLQRAEAGVPAAPKVDHRLDPGPLPRGKLEWPGLVGAHQLVGDPVGVAEAQPQIGVVVPEIVQHRAQPPAPGREIEGLQR